MDNQKNNGHGGARKGSGRRNLGRDIPLSVRISLESARLIQGVKNKSEYIDELIKKDSKT